MKHGRMVRMLRDFPFLWAIQQGWNADWVHITVEKFTNLTFNGNTCLAYDDFTPFYERAHFRGIKEPTIWVVISGGLYKADPSFEIKKLPNKKQPDELLWQRLEPNACTAAFLGNITHIVVEDRPSHQIIIIAGKGENINQEIAWYKEHFNK